MEVGPRRRIQAPGEVWTSVCLRGHWCAVFWDGGGDDDICTFGIFVPCQPWRVDDCDVASVGVHGVVRWVRFIADVQDVQGYELEEEHIEDGVHFPRSGVRDLLHSECANLGREVVRSSAVRDHVCALLLVVRDLGATCIRWKLLRVQAGSDRGPCPNQQDSTTDSRAAVVHAASVFDSNWRSATFWRCIHRTVFHLDVDLAAPVLLYIRVLVPGVFDIAGDVCGDHDSPVLLPAVQRGLQLVVEGVPYFGVISDLFVLVRCILLLQEFGNY